MGCYINPPDMSKEDWLSLNAKPLTKKDLMGNLFDWNDKTKRIVVWMDNGPFTCAGVLYSRREAVRALQPIAEQKDLRPFAVYLAEVKDLMRVSPLHKYLDHFDEN